VKHNSNRPLCSKPVGITITYTFSHCTVHFHGNGRYTETVFHDGSKVDALPGETYEYRAKARQYGYGDDCAALSREHEFLHSFLAERVRGGASHALWAVAHGQLEGHVAPLWVQEEEEAQVLAFQEYLNGTEPGEELLRFSRESGLDLENTKIEAVRLLRSFRPAY
jgi:hypothetical protein